MVFDFSAVMVLLVAGSGGIWGIDTLFFARSRQQRDAALPLDARPPEPMLVEHARSFFPIFVIVLLLRAFLIEPFRIPSGSMIPTLLIGDFILVNKYTYGLRVPVLNKVFYRISSPKRGDVVVFRYPKDPSTPFIKRIVGLPGDKITYRDKRLSINGQPLNYSSLGSYVGMKSAAVNTGADFIEETLGDVRHKLLVAPRVPSIEGENTEVLAHRGLEVPPGKYFVMGDNRDNSRDSRYWGFVPDENLIGRAFMIWMNWDKGPDIKRIGTAIN